MKSSPGTQQVGKLCRSPAYLASEAGPNFPVFSRVVRHSSRFCIKKQTSTARVCLHGNRLPQIYASCSSTPSARALANILLSLSRFALVGTKAGAGQGRGAFHSLNSFPDTALAGYMNCRDGSPSPYDVNRWVSLPRYNILNNLCSTITHRLGSRYRYPRGVLVGAFANESNRNPAG